MPCVIWVKGLSVSHVAGQMLACASWPGSDNQQSRSAICFWHFTVCSIMMFPKQPVELHKIVCPFVTFKYGTEQEVLHDMRVALWKIQICILTSDRIDLPYCRENLYSAHYLRSGVNDVFIGRHRNRLLLNEDGSSFDLFNLFRTCAKHLCFAEGAVLIQFLLQPV